MCRYWNALERLALKPQLFPGHPKTIPINATKRTQLSFWLVQQHFTQKAAGKAAKSYLNTMRLVYPQSAGYNPPSDESQEEVPPMMAPQIQTPVKSGPATPSSLLPTTSPLRVVMNGDRNPTFRHRSISKD